MWTLCLKLKISLDLFVSVFIFSSRYSEVYVSTILKKYTRQCVAYIYRSRCITKKGPWNINSFLIRANFPVGGVSSKISSVGICTPPSPHVLRHQLSHLLAIWGDENLQHHSGVYVCVVCIFFLEFPPLVYDVITRHTDLATHVAKTKDPPPPFSEFH